MNAYDAMHLGPSPKPMRLTKREVADPAELHAIVNACRTVRIGAVDAEGVFVVPMSFGYEWEDAQGGATEAGSGPSTAHPHLTLWLHSATAGRKAEAFDAEPYVAIEMDVEDGVITGGYACAYSFAYRSIMGTGRVRRVTDAAEKRHGLARIMEHLVPGAPVEFAGEAVARTNVYRVDVERFTGKQRAPKS